MRFVLATLAALVLTAGCNPFTVDKGPYGNYCPLASTNQHYCGLCAADSQCGYCPDNAQGGSTCPSDPCSTRCDSSAGGGSGGSGGSGGGGAGGSGGGGSTTGTDSNMCPTGAMLECSQYEPNGNCSVQSCTCTDGTPTAYCGIYYQTSAGGFFWCGSDANCETIDILGCAQRVATFCNPPSP